MLATSIDDEVESRRGRVDGLGLLPVEIAFAPDKTLTRPVGQVWGIEVHGYEIHHGYVTGSKAEPFIEPGDGARVGNVFGTHWHGTFESDDYRRAFLTEAARLAGRDGFRVAAGTCFAERRERVLDLLGDLVEEHLDTEGLARLIEDGPPSGLPFLPPGVLC
jgi:adenosylcobyric acid synthase